METDYEFLRRRILRNIVYRKMLDALVNKALARLESWKVLQRIGKSPVEVEQIDAVKLKDLHGNFRVTYHDFLADYYSARNFFATLQNVGVVIDYDPTTEQEAIHNVLATKKFDRRRAIFLVDIDKLVELLIPIWVELHREQ